MGEEGSDAGELVRVTVPVSFEVDYVVRVADPTNLESIKEKLSNGDPSDWESDPDFYESLGSGFKGFVSKVTEEDLSEVEEEPPIVCRFCENDCPDCREVRKDVIL